jgi:TonB family protein
MNNFQKYGLLVAIIFSVLLHLVIIKNFSFKIFQSSIQDDFDDMQITLVSTLPSGDEKSLSNKKKLPRTSPLTIISNQGDVTNKVVINNQKIIKSKKQDSKSNSKSIDTSKILSQIKNIDFSAKTDNLKDRQRVRFISANTTDYLYKLYFDAWRQKVEKIGSMNYPKEAAKLGMFGSLRLTVSLNSDGTIKNLFINKSSGHKELDLAALNIVKLGEPYARFPAEILKNVDIINITRRWKFTEKNHFSK